MQNSVKPGSFPSLVGRQVMSGLCAIALVGSLMFYQRMVVADPLTVAQQHWQAIATQDTSQALNRYHKDAVILWQEGLNQKRYQGKEIPKAWAKFLHRYRIQNYQILSQGKNSDRLVKADVVLVADQTNGHQEVVIVSYSAHIDAGGKIIREIWHATPRFSV
ncbi:MAG: hypothetical protein ACTS2F_04310 [Thainema sp.]